MRKDISENRVEILEIKSWRIRSDLKEQNKVKTIKTRVVVQVIYK